MTVETSLPKGVTPYVEILESTSGYPPGVQLLEFESGLEKKEIPIFDLRNESHHELIAQNYASFKTGVVFGIGVYGVTAAVEFPTVGKHPDSNQAFTKVKPDRSPLNKIPLHIHPKDMSKIMDFNMIHPEFRKYVDSREAREEFYRQGVAMHLVVPIKKDFCYLDQIFVTQPEDWKAKKVPQDQWISHPTVAAFWWDDPDQESIYLKTQRLNPYAFSGISSFNDSGEDPAWDEAGVLKYLRDKGRCPFQFMVKDSDTERMEVKSSHPQIATPLIGDDPTWKVYRTGATDINAFMERIGSKHPYRMVESYNQAPRAYSQDENLDPRVLKAHEAIDLNYKSRHPKRTGIRGVLEKILA